MDRRISADLTDAGLILVYLAQHPTATDQELAFMMGETLDSVQQQLAYLIDNGLLARGPAGGLVRYTGSPRLPERGKLERLLALLKEGTANEDLQVTGTGGVKWLFQQLWEQGSDAMVISDPQGIVLGANRKYLNLLGYDAGEVVGRHISLFAAPAERERTRENFQRIFIAKSLPSGVDRTMQRKDGSLRMVRSRLSFMTENYTRTAMFAIVRDVTGSTNP